MNEEDYKYFKGLEMLAQKMLFELPHQGSSFYEALSSGISDWEVGALIHGLTKLRDAAARAAELQLEEVE